MVAKSASFGHGSLVCGLWLAGGGLGGSVPTYVLGTFYIRFFCTWATVSLFWVKPTVPARPFPQQPYDGTRGTCVVTEFLVPRCSPYFFSACEIKKSSRMHALLPPISEGPTPSNSVNTLPLPARRIIPTTIQRRSWSLCCEGD